MLTWKTLVFAVPVAASLLWLLGSTLLSWYLSNFGNYTATYGSLGAAIGLMTWMWMSAIIVLVGAELNSEIERQAEAGTAQGSLKSAPASSSCATHSPSIARKCSGPMASMVESPIAESIE